MLILLSTSGCLVCFQPLGVVISAAVNTGVQCLFMTLSAFLGTYPKVKLLGPLVIVFVVQLLSCVQLVATPWMAAHQASLVLHYLLEFAQTQIH